MVVIYFGFFVFINYFNNINWIQEKHFRDDIYKIINGLTDDGMIMFVVDDDIFFRPFKDKSLLDHLSNRHLFISLRLSSKYNNMQNPRIPKFINKSKYLEWKWYIFNQKKVKYNHWYYPFSLDGNIFNTTDIKKMLTMIQFKAPNSFESAMNSKKNNLYFLLRRKGLAPLNPVVFNNPLNIIQTEGETWHKNYSIEMLNQYYLDGKKIDNSNFYKFRPNDVHCYCPISIINMQSN